VQIDGSEHAWFEDRGPPCTLLAFVDDATSRLMELRFVTSESAFDYFRTTRAALMGGRHGGSLSDRAGLCLQPSARQPAEPLRHGRCGPS
jgi:hypothetical protein